MWYCTRGREFFSSETLIFIIILRSFHYLDFSLNRFEQNALTQLTRQGSPSRLATAMWDAQSWQVSKRLQFPMTNIWNYVDTPCYFHRDSSWKFQIYCNSILMECISSRSMKYIGLFWLHFRATCAIPVETWQRPSGFCLQLSFFLSGMSLANSRFEMWFSFNAIDASVSCFINLICNGNISNHSSPHFVFG